jgi:hypothetical protein
MTGLLILTAVAFTIWLSRALHDATTMLLPMIQTDERDQ